MTDHATNQLALFMNARDHRDYGTAAWADLDIVGQEAYLADATALVAAVKALGWGPVDDEVAELREVLAGADHTAAKYWRRMREAESEAASLREALEQVWSVIQRDVRDLANLDPAELGGIIARALDPSRLSVAPERSVEHGCELGEDCDGRCNEVAGETPGFVQCPCGWSKIGMFSDLHDHQRTHPDLEPEGEAPDDQRESAWIPNARRALIIHDTWGTPDDPDGKTRPMSDYTELSARMANALRAALAVTEQGESR